MEDEYEPLTILYCGANPIDKRSNHIDLGKECQAIREAIDGSSRFRLYPEYAMSHDLLVRLLSEEQPTVVHFGLHGLRAGASDVGALRDLTAELGPDGGLVLIERDGAPVLLDAAKLKKILKSCGRLPRCVVMSACHSEHAARLLAEDVDHVVGMKGAISDAGAIAFSRAFYRNLAKALTFREALERAALVLHAPEDDYPVLFQRPGVPDAGLLARPQVHPPVPFRWSWAIALALVLGFLSAVLLAYGYGPFVSDIRQSLMSQRSQVAPLNPSERLRVVLIDEQTVAALKNTSEGGHEVGAYGTGWRVLYARAVDRLTDSGVKVIVFDVAFQDEPAGALDELGTAALAQSIGRAAQRGTQVVLTAFERDRKSGNPRIAASLLQALAALRADHRCLVAHPCIGVPARGPSVPLLPLVLEGEPPSFALSLCAYALAKGTLPSWSPETGQLFLARDHALPVAFTGLESAPDIADCGMAKEGAGAVQRLLGPFAKDLARGSARVVPFETLVGEPRVPVPDVAGKIVLIGQHTDQTDVLLADAAPVGGRLWGVSAHAAAIDALMTEGGMMSVLSPTYQMVWVGAASALVLFLSLRLGARPTWLPTGALLLLAGTDVLASVLLARNGMLSDPGNHLLAMLVAYVVASKLRAKLRITFA